jgi:hypothetical protein
VTGFGLGWFMVFNATFNNISVISWQPILLVEETGENLYHIIFFIAKKGGHIRGDYCITNVV